MGDLFLSLAAMSVVSSITPGPNNVMLMASGARFGITRTLPHLAGIWVGFSLMMALVGLGCGAVIESQPEVHRALKFVAAAFIVYIAWKIARAGAIEAETDGAFRPMRPHEAALFQAVNPKAWSMILAVMALFTTATSDKYGEVAWIVGVFSLFGIPCSFTWCLAGHFLARFFRSPRIAAIANVAMAVLLVLTVLPMLI